MLPIPSVRLLPALFVLAAGILPCRSENPALSVKVQRQGLMEGFPAGTKNQEGEPVWFESSAVATDGTSVWFSSDKPAPGTTLSSVVRYPLASLREKSVVPWSDAVPVMVPLFRGAQKIESATVSEDGARFVCTAFDRFVPQTKIADPFNVIVAWRGADPSGAAVLNATTRDESTSSISLRDPIRAALRDTTWPEGPPYFKIEALAALPGHRLWFGIREAGKDGRSPENFSYRFTVLEASWEEKDDRIAIVPEFRRILDASSAMLAAAGITGSVGLSSLEYDPTRKIVWAVATWEEEKYDGSWLLALTAPPPGETPSLLQVRDAAGLPQTFNHKVEGLCIVDPSTLLLVSDEDRRTPVIETPEGPKTRAPHTGVWSLVEVVTGK